MIDKIQESLTSQQSQLLTLLTSKEQLEKNLKDVTEGILQLKGSISALEYVKTLASPPTTS
jgi:hypothetical protein